MDYGDTYCSELDETPQYFHKIIVPIGYFLVFLLGTIGNSLVLLILLRYKHSRSPTDSYLLHLAVADLLLVLVLPFFAIESIFGWLFGTVLCKVLGSIHKLNFFCNSLLLACISIDRYMAIVYAVQTHKNSRAKYVHLICSAVWVTGFILQIPNLIFLQVEAMNNENETKCTYTSAAAHDWLLAEQFLYHGIGFTLPLTIMCYCYAKIISTLYKTQNFGKHKAIKVVVTVTVMFCICWAPYNVAKFIKTLRNLDVISADCSFYKKLTFTIVVSESTGFIHSCLNPVLYVFIGVKFRKDILKVLRELHCISQATLENYLHKKHAERSRNSSVFDNTTSWSTL
ncbi:C-X-C chemokine receptor type 5 [Pristis pectinata]|uniref:C-X-C chemokine receptor type 5 n=1 Tax=Pristis pectinata TaxID=685728 RepID=UPI00223E42B3|nr:C-X-C chemokine receptor type 5 [Pristis pectinata]